MDAEWPDLLRKIINGLNQLKIEYVIGGSVASSIRGEFRATNDLDIVAKFEKQVVPSFCNFFLNDFYVDELSVEKAVNEQRSFNIIDKKSFLKVAKDVISLADAEGLKAHGDAVRVRLELSLRGMQ